MLYAKLELIDSVINQISASIVYCLKYSQVRHKPSSVLARLHWGGLLYVEEGHLTIYSVLSKCLIAEWVDT